MVFRLRDMVHRVTVCCPDRPCECLNRWDQCFIRLLDGMLQVVGFAGASDGDFALRIPVKIRAISIIEPGGSARAVLPCNVQRVLGIHPLPPAVLLGLDPRKRPQRGYNPLCCSCKVALAVQDGMLDDRLRKGVHLQLRKERVRILFWRRRHGQHAARAHRRPGAGARAPRQRHRRLQVSAQPLCFYLLHWDDCRAARFILDVVA